VAIYVDDTFRAHMCRRLLGAVVSHMGYVHKSANSSTSLIMLVQKITTSHALLIWKPPQDPVE